MFRIKNLSEDFINKIIEQAAGKVQKNILEDFLSLLEKEISRHYFTRTSESNLLRIILHQFDIVFFINECIRYQHQIEILISIANNSNYLSDILVRNPEYFFWANTPSVINFVIDEKYYSESLSELLLKYKSFDAKVNVIRNFKRKEILRIGLKDIYLKEDLILITGYLSNLAKIITRELFNLCYFEILSKHKIEKSSNKYVLLALGKLGGNELNYSSDIDLIAFYDKNTLKGKRILYDQLLTETILLFIETATQKTGAGFLYRIDFRLRPDGRNAPLCGSIADYLRYYEMRGEDWERQMMIKAGFVCGNKNLFDRFLKEISNFIYPVSFLLPPTEQIKKLKLNIEAKRNEIDIKLSSGGIRDIEFSLQVLQLINGGKDPDIRTGNTLNAIKLLQQKNILTDDEAVIFNEAYILYRRIEHYLQLMNDQQTHSIPKEGELLEKLANYLGYKNSEIFKDKLGSMRTNVKNIFNSIVGPEIKVTNTSLTSKISFIDNKRSQSNIDFLKTGKSILNKKSFDNRTVNSFEKIEEQLYDFLLESIDPDLVLENFARFIRTAAFPKIWFDEFRDSNFFKLFLIICERSQKTINLSAEDKALREDFLSRECLAHFNLIDYTALTLKSFLFRASVQIASGTLAASNFSSLYSDYISKNLDKIITEFSIDKEWKDDFFTGALGSFGSEQLHFNSDIDLIFVVRDLHKYPTIQKDFQKLLQKVKYHFSNLEIDCRLRPEGKSSQLVWDLNNYKKYFSSRIRIWELQSLTKCRFIYGNKNLFVDFMSAFVKTVKEKNPVIIKSEIFEMRKKLVPISESFFDVKKSSGGLMDIDFIIEYILLLKPELLLSSENKTTNERINGIRNFIHGKINFKDLLENREFLKSLGILIQNIFDIRSTKIPNDETKLIKLAKALGFSDHKLFVSKIEKATNDVRKAYLEIFTK